MGSEESRAGQGKRAEKGKNKGERRKGGESMREWTVKGGERKGVTQLQYNECVSESLPPAATLEL